MPVTVNAKPTSKWTNVRILSIGIAAFIAITPCLNYLLIAKSISPGNAELLKKNAGLEARLRQMEALIDHDPQSSPLLVKAKSIDSYWWPSAEEGGGKNNHFTR